jgi:hypothetical protein
MNKKQIMRNLREADKEAEKLRNKERWAFEKQTIEGVWWQELHRLDSRREAERWAADRLTSGGNCTGYKAVRVVDTQSPDYVEDAVPIDY